MCSACSVTLKKHHPSAPGHICGTGTTGSALPARAYHMVTENNGEKGQILLTFLQKV